VIFSTWIFTLAPRALALGARAFHDWAVAIACCSLAAVTVVAGAQGTAKSKGRELIGVVRDTQGQPIEGVRVEIPSSTVETNVRGAFQLFTLEQDTVTITVRALGYTAVSATLTAHDGAWDPVLVELDRAQILKGVTIRESPTRNALALRSFEERRSKGNGVFVTRADIVARGASHMSDVLRNTRGVTIVRGRVRFVSQTGQRGTVCQPDIWLDGTRARGMEVDDILAGDVEAMELYSNFSLVPFEFSSRGANSLPCGSIVIWTRIPNGRSP
jgi:hypothetical protein